MTSQEIPTFHVDQSAKSHCHDWVRCRVWILGIKVQLQPPSSIYRFQWFQDFYVWPTSLTVAATFSPSENMDIEWQRSKSLHRGFLTSKSCYEWTCIARFRMFCGKTAAKQLLWDKVGKKRCIMCFGPVSMMGLLQGLPHTLWKSHISWMVPFVVFSFFPTPPLGGFL